MNSILVKIDYETLEFSLFMTPFQSFLGPNVGHNIKDKNAKFHISTRTLTYKDFLKKF